MSARSDCISDHKVPYIEHSWHLSSEAVRGVFIWVAMEGPVVAEGWWLTLKLELEGVFKDRASELLPPPAAASVRKPLNGFI